MSNRNRNEIHVPPHDIDAEKSLIGSLLLDPTRLDEVTDLVTREAFYLAVAGRVFAVVHEMADSGKAIDPVTVFERMQATGKAEEGDYEWLIAALNCVPHAAHARHYAGIVGERWMRREMLYAAHDGVASAHALELDIDESLSAFDQRICNLIERRSGGSSQTDISAILVETLQILQSGAPSGLSTGFHGLDNLGCTLKPGSLTILAARPSNGKTSLLGNIALNVSRSGVGVLFVSLEQNRHELAARFLSSQSEVPNLVAGRFLNSTEIERVLNASDILQALPMQIEDASGLTVSKIAAIARVQKRKKNIGCLLVDYLQIVEPENRRIPREQQVADITRGLRNIARNLEIPVVLLAQLNRQIETREDKRPRLSDLRESGSIEQDADMVWFIDRPATYNPEAPESEAHLVVAKHRNGKTGSIPMNWSGATMTFTDATGAPPDSVSVPSFPGDEFANTGLYAGSMSQF